MRRGYIQVYTGNGKGKTTAALGLALRAAGAGYRVFIAQFIKKAKCSEHKALERFKDQITIKQYGNGLILKRAPDTSDLKTAERGLKEATRAIHSGAYDVVVLDEINVAVYYNLIPINSLLELIANRPEGLELVLTGRHADKRVIRKADLVTEMREIKHYKDKGITARVGIEK